jgi:hypothetical protein
LGRNCGENLRELVLKKENEDSLLRKHRNACRYCNKDGKPDFCDISSSEFPDEIEKIVR